ncbi:MAG: FecR domain-containing protein [Candidatus Didemnitutus sp.]|nr:FecR domain-containing protein [Candidatus Didemnitutus sp.]
MALALTLAASAQTNVGVIKIGKIEGEVTRISADGKTTLLKAGDRVGETDAIATGRDSLVVLVFMNGSSVKIGADSRLSIDEFKMDPLAEDIQVADLQNEPSVSQTSLSLAYGEMIGEVKKLNTASNYTIKTPVGAAGIRGTTYRIVFRPTGDGRAFTFQLSTGEGLVVFEGTTQAGSGRVDVAQDQEVVVTATVNPTTGEVTLTAPSSAQTISVEAKAQIDTAVTQVIKEAKDNTIITVVEQKAPVEPTTTPTTTPTTEEKPKTEETKTTTTEAKTDPLPTTPSTPTSKPPELTPGAGG